MVRDTILFSYLPTLIMPSFDDNDYQPSDEEDVPFTWTSQQRRQLLIYRGQYPDISHWCFDTWVEDCIYVLRKMDKSESKKRMKKVSCLMLIILLCLMQIQEFMEWIERRKAELKEVPKKLNQDRLICLTRYFFHLFF